MPSCERTANARPDALIRHPCMSDKPTQNRLSRRNTVVCFSVTVHMERGSDKGVAIETLRCVEIADGRVSAICERRV